MKKIETKRIFAIAGQMLMMVFAVLLGGGAGLAVGVADAPVSAEHTPEATVVNPTAETAAVPGGSAVFPEQSVTTGSQASPETYEPQYDKLLTKVRPVRTPIDQISRLAKRGGTPIKSMEFKYGTIGYLPNSTTLKTGYADPGGQTADHTPATLETNNNGIFNRRDLIIVKGVHGYNADGTDSTEDLKLWVQNRNGSKSIDVIALNGITENGFASQVPELEAGTKLIRIAKACAELDSQAPGYAIFPSTSEQYMQKFMAQVEQSTIDAMTAKRFDITLNDQEEAVLADMRLGMEGAFLFGTKAKFLDPDTQRYVWACGGVWNMVSASVTYSDADYWTLETLISLAQNVFTGPGAGRSDKRLVVCGSDLLATFEKLFASHYTFVHKVNKWDLSFTQFDTNFGSFEFILDEVFDQHGMSGCALILDPDYMEKYVFQAFGRNELDLDASGTRDSRAVVLREISSLVLKSPDNHLKIIKEGEATA